MSKGETERFGGAALLHTAVFAALHWGSMEAGQVMDLFAKREENLLALLIHTAPMVLTAITAMLLIRASIDERFSMPFVVSAAIILLVLAGSTWLCNQVSFLGIETAEMPGFKGSVVNTFVEALVNYYMVYHPYYFFASIATGAYFGWFIYKDFIAETD